MLKLKQQAEGRSYMDGRGASRIKMPVAYESIATRIVQKAQERGLDPSDLDMELYRELHEEVLKEIDESSRRTP